MAVTPNTLTTNEMTKAQVREADFTLMFSEGIRVLREMLGNVRLIAKEAGTVLKTYKAVGTLESGDVAEGEVIPLSMYKVEAVEYKELKLRKWARSTTAETILNYGFNQGVTMTTNKMLRDAQNTIRKSLLTTLGEGSTTAEGTGLQEALANVWAKLTALFEDIDNDVQPVYFINPVDAAAYLGKANITTQEVFGMQYIKNFLSLGDVFITAGVPAGKVYATSKSNIIGYFANVGSADLGEAFTFTTDELGMIGIHEEADYRTMTAVDTMISGVEFFPEYADGVVVGTIKAAPSA